MNEEKLTMKDIIGLALKGWSKDDIKELFELANSKEGSSDDGGQETPENNQVNEKPEEENTPPKDEPEENSDNINNLNEEILKLKKQLKEAQEANNSSDLSGQTDKQTDIDVINDLARSFM